MKKTLDLFITMFKIGLFTFGGGYVIIAMLENEFVSRKKWIEKEEFLDLVAIAESTPGPIAINAATYIGYKAAGISGSVIATAAVCLPSLAIIYIISLFFDAFLSLTYVAYAFKGIQACVVYLVFSAGMRMFKGIKKTAFNVAIFLSVTACIILCSVFAVNFSSVFYILICGGIGVLAYLIKKIRAREEKK